MVLSTLIPSAILKMSMVDGLIEIPAYPIMAAVSICGMRLGINEMTIILNDEKVRAINKAIMPNAKSNDEMRLLTK